MCEPFEGEVADTLSISHPNSTFALVCTVQLQNDKVLLSGDRKRS